jgi:predicted flap endonuclease-1-like 5' DNA nuclease
MIKLTMFLLEFDPLSKPVAIAEMVIILAIAALLGYFLAKAIARSRIKILQTEIVETQVELEVCRAKPKVSEITVSPPSSPNKGALSTVYPIHETDPKVRQDLKVVEGIGPKIEEILNKNGIMNYEALSAVPAIRIAAILRSAGPRFQIHDPTSWPQQASLAHEGKWAELETLKHHLLGGKAN